MSPHGRKVALVVRVVPCAVGADVGAVRVDTPQGTLILIHPTVDPGPLLVELLSPGELEEIA